MRWLVAVILGLSLTLLIAYPVSAGSSDDITITATGYVCEAPGGLTITYISDYELGLSWSKGTDAVNTMVRAKYGSVPTSRTDGYLVYYGDGTSASDTGVNLDETLSDIYYRAWSQNASGVWEESGTANFWENVAVTLGVMAFLAFGFSTIAFLWKRGVLFLTAMIAWFIMGGYSYTRQETEYDIYFALFMLCMAFGIICLYEAFSMRVRKVDTGQDEEDLNEDMSDIYETRREIEKTNQRNSKLYQGRQGGGGNRPPRRLSF